MTGTIVRVIIVFLRLYYMFARVKMSERGNWDTVWNGLSLASRHRYVPVSRESAEFIRTGAAASRTPTVPFRSLHFVLSSIERTDSQNH